MRISSTMMSNNYLKQLNGTYEQYSKLMEQADGSKLHRASDNAVGYSKYLRYQNNQISNEQYQSNVSTAASWMKNADAALVNVTDLLQTFKAKVEQGSNSTNNESDMKDIAKELLANVQEQVADLNTQIGDRFLFAGQKDTTMPFEISADKMNRGDTFTLDEKQSAFFSGASNWGEENTTLKQMLKLQCTTDDGKGNKIVSTYYMNVNTGDIFTEDFVKNGYKNQENFDAARDRVICVNEYRDDGSRKVLQNDALKTFFGSKNLKDYTGTIDGKSYYVDGAGNIYDKAAASPNVVDVINVLEIPVSDLQIPSNNMYNMNQATATGQEIYLNDTQQAYFSSKKLVQYKDAGSGYNFYVDEKGNQYTQDTINDAQDLNKNGVLALTKNSLTPKANLKDKAVNNFRVNDFFNENGVINTAGEVLQVKDNKGNILDLAGDGKSKTGLSTTKQYIVKYAGDDKYISMVKKNGGVDKATDTVNVTGQDINGCDLFDVGNDPHSGTARLNQLLYTVAKMDAADYKWAGEQGMTIADSAHATVLGAQTKMAARQQAYKSSSSMLVTQNESITSDISDVSSTDVAQLATKLMEYQTIYSLSLSVGSKILPGTLADYL